MSDSLISDLKSILDGESIESQNELAEVSTDFGRLMHKTPKVIAAPSSAGKVAEVFKYAYANDIQVSTRGGGHTQTGQSLVDGGIVISSRNLNRILEVDEENLTATVEGGAVWGDLVKHLDPMGLVPRVLTNNLNVTIGGTLSVAGLGVASFRYGAQGDNVEEIEAVTPTGDIVDCSPENNSEYFDIVRSGLGQFGAIAKAKIKLRKREPKNRTYILLYDNLDALMKDAETVMSDGRFDFLESWCVPLPVGFKNDDGRRRVFGEWFFPLHLTKEFPEDASPKDTELLEGLTPYRKSHQEDRTALEFAFRLEPLFELWRRSGYWDNTHPWMEAVLPWQTTPFYINAVLEKLPPPALGGGHVLLWPCTGDTSNIPLFMRPAGDLVMGFGILPGMPKEFVEPLLEALQKASDGSVMVGGKRYLSGWINFDRAKWKTHFGDKWTHVCAMKKKYDPKGLLNPGFIDFE
jgi:cytokinin dehydrogenase